MTQKKRLKIPGDKAREPEVLLLAVSSLVESEQGAVILSASGATLESLLENDGIDGQWLLAQLVNCFEEDDDEGFNVEKDRGIWIYVGFPTVTSNTEDDRVVDFSDGELRRPTDKELTAFAFGPPPPDDAVAEEGVASSQESK